MRIRNVEKSFYLSKEENKLLLDKCKKLNLNQSDCIRKLIEDYEPKKYDGSIFEKHNNDIKDINLKLEAIIESINKYGYIILIFSNGFLSNYGKYILFIV